MDSRARVFDTLSEMKDAGLVASSAAATVGGSAATFDTGGGKTPGDLVVDVTAVEVDNGDEKFTITLQGGDSAAFDGDIVNLATLELGDAAALVGNVDKAAGRYIVPFNNKHGDTVYRYLRVYTTVVGTVTVGINFSAFLSKSL